MSSTMEQARRFNAVRIADDQETALGTVLLDATGRLTVLTTTPAAAVEGEAEDVLTRIARIANENEVMHVDVPPDDDAPEFALVSRIIERDEPDFIPALLDYLRATYWVELRPT